MKTEILSVGGETKAVIFGAVAEPGETAERRQEEEHRDFELYIDHDGIPLHARLEFPEIRPKESRFPLVILLHGYTGHMEETHIKAVAETLRGKGCAILRIELFGHGKSGGTFRTHTILKWMSEMMTVIDYAAAFDFVSDLYLAGHSQGGLLTALAGAMKQDKVKALILLSPAFMIPEAARKGCLLGTVFDPDHIPDTVLMPDDRQLSGNYFRAARMVNPEMAIRDFEKPVLIVHGDNDESVPVRYAQEAAKLYKQAELTVISGDTHCYDRHLDRVCEAVAKYMERMLSLPMNP